MSKKKEITGEIVYVTKTKEEASALLAKELARLVIKYNIPLEKLATGVKSEKERPINNG